MAATVPGMRPIIAVLLVFTVAGCGVHRSAAPAPDTTTATTTTTTVSTTVSTTTTVAPTTAADGTNLRACQDRTCEVAIRPGDAIPVDTLGILTVANVTADGITMVMPAGGVLTFSGGEFTINDTIVITTLRLELGAAIIRVVPV